MIQSNKSISYRGAAPCFFSIIIVIIGAVNLQISGISSFIPLFAAMSVFYWSMYWPRLMPKWFVFLLGFFQDFLYGTPPGITSVLLLSLWGVVVLQRELMSKQPFIILWLMYIVTISIYAIMQFIAYSIYYTDIMYYDAGIMQLLLSIAIYPIIHIFFNSVHITMKKEG